MYLALLHKIHYYNAKLIAIKIENPLKKIEFPNTFHEKAKNRTWEYYTKQENFNELLPYYPEYSKKEDIVEIFNFKKSNFVAVSKNGITLLNNTQSKFYNTVDNHRITTDSPREFVNSIYVFGHCAAVGVYAEDKNTVESYLQRELNSYYKFGIKVVNCANWSLFPNTVRQIASPRYEFKRNDIIILLTHQFDENKFFEELNWFQDKSFFTFKDLDDIFNHYNDSEEAIFFDSIHMNHHGYKIIA